MSRAREQVKRNRQRGKRAPEPAPDPDQLTIDDALAELARDERGRPVTVLAEPAATANYETDR